MISTFSNSKSNVDGTTYTDFQNHSSISVLGSTGSVGTQALDVLRKSKDFFTLDSLSAYSNIELLITQIREFSPKAVAVKEESHKLRLIEEFGHELIIYVGEDSPSLIASRIEVDIVILAIVGFPALPPLITSIKSGKKIAIANKESLIAGASIVKAALEEYPTKLVPVDSEHNAIYQALKARPGERPRRIILTASGGPFLNLDKSELENVTPSQAMKHPRWEMGAKISIDSAGLMNKGLEVIEASVLFDLPESDIEVLIHPQSFVHGFVEYSDGSTLALCYEPDMRVPILNAICDCADCGNALATNFHSFEDYPISPSRSASGSSWFETGEKRQFDFYPVDYEKFPSLKLCRLALQKGGTSPLALNAANDVALEAFVNNEIRFTDIPRVVEKVLNEYTSDNVSSFSELLLRDREVRSFTKDLISAWSDQGPFQDNK